MTTEEAMHRLEICPTTCCDCGTCGDHDDALVLAIAAMREQAERENPKPLTLEELKNRNWVWIDNDTSRGNKGYAKVYPMYKAARMEVLDYWFKDYGKTWLAYDYPPKESVRSDQQCCSDQKREVTP